MWLLNVHILHVQCTFYMWLLTMLFVLNPPDMRFSKTHSPCGGKWLLTMLCTVIIAVMQRSRITNNYIEMVLVFSLVNTQHPGIYGAYNCNSDYDQVRLGALHICNKYS